MFEQICPIPALDRAHCTTYSNWAYLWTVSGISIAAHCPTSSKSANSTRLTVWDAMNSIGGYGARTMRARRIKSSTALTCRSFVQIAIHVLAFLQSLIYKSAVCKVQAALLYWHIAFDGSIARFIRYLKEKRKPATQSIAGHSAEKPGFEPGLRLSHTTPLAGSPFGLLGTSPSRLRTRINK